MKLIPLTISRVSHNIYFFLLVLLFVSVPAKSQTEKSIRVGAPLTLELEKELSRNLSLILEEEIRLENNGIGFNRTATSLGFDYSLFDKKLKVGGFYTYIYLYNNDYLFESRHRLYLNMSYKETFEPFTFMWRGRLQSTFRDENRGSYNVNPKYVLKNKFEVSYTIFGSPIKPFASVDFSNYINNPDQNFELTRIRYSSGVNWRLNRTNYIELFLRFDQRTDRRDPDYLGLGATYKVKL